MNFLYFLLKGSSWLDGSNADWSMPHSLWYENENGYILGILLTAFISLISCLVYYQIFPRIFRNTPMSRLNWLLFMILNAGVVFFSCYFVAKKGIMEYADLHDYLADSPAMMNILDNGTTDMWLFAAQNSMYSLILFFLFSFICRIKSRGFNIPF